MRNLVRPQKKKESTTTTYKHKCYGLDGINTYSAFCTKGLLKIVNQHIDSEAKGYHEKHTFILETKYDRDELLDYLSIKYQPCSFIPVYSKALYGKSYLNTLEEIKDIHPEYYSKVIRNKIIIDNWLEENDCTPEDIKGNVLFELFHSLNSIITDSDVLEYIKVVGIPYTIRKKKGNLIKKIWFSPLFNKSLGRIGKGNIWTSYLKSIRDITRESWECSIFGTPHKVMGEYPMYSYDLKNWGSSREGKSESKDKIVGYGIRSGEESLGTPADMLMLIASLTFFRGYTGEKYSHSINLHSDTPIIKKKPVFTLCVRNSAPSFHTGLWSEMTTSNTSKYLLGVEEIFVPMFNEPLTFNQARERLSHTAELPISTSINNNRDLMNHLSQHATQTGIDSYMRFSCVSRGGVGMSQLNFLIPVEEFDPKKSRRNDIVSPFMNFYNECLYKLKIGNLPYSLKTSVESFITSINEFSMSRSTPKEIMYSFLDVLNAITITDKKYLSGKLSREYFKSKSFSIPSWWMKILEKGDDSSEIRIAKSIHLNKQLCTFEDILELLEDRLDTNLIESYIQFFKFMKVEDEPEISSNGKIWLPIDFLVNYKFLSYQKYDLDDSRNAWEFCMDNDDTMGALSISLYSLYNLNLIKSFVYPFTSTEKNNMIMALRIPISKKDQRRLRSQLN